MKKTDEQLKLKAKILKQSLQLYKMSKTTTWIDYNGRERKKLFTWNDVARMLFTTERTIRRWTETGKISPHFETLLLRNGILKRRIW